MVHRSALAPQEGGYCVYIRGLEPQGLAIGAAEPDGLLTVRQRFAFAHEIAHTLFYKFSARTPVATGEVPNKPDLEEICDRGAKRILAPKSIVQSEVKARLDTPERIDVDFVRAISAHFRVSHRVMIERLRVAYPENEFARCIVLVENDEGTHKVAAGYVGVPILSVFPSTADYPLLSKWLPELPPETASQTGKSTSRQTVRGRNLLIEKFPLGPSGDFLLQIDDLDNLAPSSQ